MPTDLRTTIAKSDHAAMLAIARRRHPGVTKFLRVLTWTGEGRSWGIFLGVLGVGTYFDILRFPHREFTLYALLAPGISWIFVKALKLFWRRKRPFQVLENYPRLTPAPLDDSFPSGHAASVFAFLAAMSPLGFAVSAALAVWASIVAFSRYYLGVHFPSDIFVGALIGILTGTGLGYGGIRYAHADGDKYPCFAELAKHEREGTDYVVKALDRKSKVLVLAIHGANIEPGSDDVADAIAETDWSKYTFRALKTENAWDLHITSTHFDDPRALALAAKSRVCVSVHGYRENAKESVCLGGGNAWAMRRVQSALRHSFPTIELNVECKSLGGTDPKNIVNRCREKGVQLELSRKLRDRLLADPAALAAFGKSVRNSVTFSR
jgi:phage replication-related protein YjqB (UPF0714/DUF867 family)/membrane-associated phospholipid phosphatase